MARLPRNPFVLVSRASIDGGWANNCKMCPIARAIGHILPVEYRVEVFRDRAKIYQGFDCIAWYKLPQTAREFIDEFDNAIAGKVGPKRRKVQRYFQPFGFRMTLI